MEVLRERATGSLAHRRRPAGEVRGGGGGRKGELERGYMECGLSLYMPCGKPWNPGPIHWEPWNPGSVHWEPWNSGPIHLHTVWGNVGGPYTYKGTWNPGPIHL